MAWPRRVPVARLRLPPVSCACRAATSMRPTVAAGPAAKTCSVAPSADAVSLSPSPLSSSDGVGSASVPAAGALRWWWRRRGLLHQFVQPLAVQAGLLERLAAAPVWQHQFGRVAHVLGGDFGAAVQRGERAGRLVHHDIGTQARHFKFAAQRADEGEQRVGQRDPGQHRLGRGKPRAQRIRVGLPVGNEARRVGLERQAPAHHLGPDGGIARGGHLHHHAEAVQQLRAQVALFEVHGAEQRDARGVAHRQALALDRVVPHGRHIEQHVDQVVGQQVDLVDIQQATVRRGQQARLECLAAVLERALDVEVAEHAVFGGAQRQVDEGHRRAGVRGGAGAAGLAFGQRRVRCAVEGAAGHPRDGRQHVGQAARGGALGGALVAADQHAAQGRVDRAQQQGALELFLADDGAEWVGVHHRSVSARASSMASLRRCRACSAATVSGLGSAHIWRWMASSRRSVMALSAHGLLSARNCCMAGSRA